MRIESLRRSARRILDFRVPSLGQSYGVNDFSADRGLLLVKRGSSTREAGIRSLTLRGFGNGALGSWRSFFSGPSVQEGVSPSHPFLRFCQVRGLASVPRFRNGPRVDIGARARRNQERRLWTVVLCGSVIAGFIVIVLNTFQENLLFYVTPSQALEKYYVDPSKNKFRLGGLVLEGSVHHFKSSADMEFIITDLANEILVRYRGALPDLFREGQSVVAEGYLKPIEKYPARADTANGLNEDLVEKAKGVGCYLAAVEVLAKHDEKYMPPEVAAAIEKNKANQEASALLTVPSADNSDTMPAVQTHQAPSPTAKSKKTVAQTPSQAKKYEF